MATKTVLIVDDEPHIRYMLEFKLRGAGYRVVAANGGHQAYELATKRFPNAVVTDFQMLDGDGMSLCRELAANAQTARIPIILLTARGHRIPADDLAEVNVKHVIAKPFSLREVLQKLETMLEAPIDEDALPRNAAGPGQSGAAAA
ncbi:MAG: response regulator [Planctomycetota bacterium]|jgi:two-component system phosphate regulon response regulator PhoB